MESKGIHTILKKYWGYDSFRDKQQEIIQSVLSGQDTLALLPTGGGKSICFQVPALAQDGICLVVSPLIALMKDQVYNLIRRGIKAKALVGGMHYREIDILLDNCIYGDEKFLYISPERLQNELFQARVRKMKVNLIAVDEAHCISQWGYDFRPDYLKINELRTLLPDVPVLALTATATPEVVEDIQDKLEFQNPNVFQKSFFRENLTYYCIQSDNKWAQTQDLIQKFTGKSGIVYVRNRRQSKEYANYLSSLGIAADYYHGGLNGEERSQKQEAWIANKTQVIVATNAFGMGIDKPDVRFVIHIDLPDSLEAYFQEAGRGGRDGKSAISILIHNKADKIKLEENLALSFPPKDEIRRVYRAIGNYFRLAVGSGKDQEYPFDIKAFAKAYNFSASLVLSSISVLSKLELLELTDYANYSSRFKFEVNYNRLYNFFVAESRYEALIMLLIRAYGGIYDHYAKIDEAKLASLLKVNRQEVIKQLRYFQKLNLADYIEGTDKPLLIFRLPRIHEKDIQFSKEAYEHLKAVRTAKVEGVLGYVLSPTCRSITLLKYFGEISSKRCGKCDNCKRTAAQKINLNLVNFIHNQAEKPMAISALVEQFETTTESVLHTLRWMIDEGEISISENDEVIVAKQKRNTVN